MVQAFAWANVARGRSGACQRCPALLRLSVCCCAGRLSSLHHILAAVVAALAILLPLCRHKHGRCGMSEPVPSKQATAKAAQQPMPAQTPTKGMEQCTQRPGSGLVKSPGSMLLNNRPATEQRFRPAKQNHQAAVHASTAVRSPSRPRAARSSSSSSSGTWGTSPSSSSAWDGHERREGGEQRRQRDAGLALSPGSGWHGMLLPKRHELPIQPFTL